MSQCFLRQVYIKIDLGVNLDRRVCSKNKSTKGTGRKIWVLGFNDNSSFVFHSLSFGCAHRTEWRSILGEQSFQSCT